MFNNAGINKVFLVGHIGRTPRLHTQTDGQSFYCFPLSTSESIKKSTQSIEHIEWHQIKVPCHQFNDLASGLEKGHMVYIEGKIKTRAFVDEQGVKRYRAEVVSGSVKVLSTQPAATFVEQV
jgi:single-strand DNA-binding protein